MGLFLPYSLLPVTRPSNSRVTGHNCGMRLFSTTRQDVKTAVGQAFQPDSGPAKVRLESLTYLIIWRVVDYFC